MARLSERLARHGTGETVGEGEGIGRDRPVYTELPLAFIEPDPDQPRKDLGDLEELKASIEAHGIIQPLVVTAQDFNRYRLVAGERRFTAARALGLATVPAIVRSLEEHRRLEVQLVENLHRKDLNPLEEAESYRRLCDEFGLTQEELGKRVGKSQPSINLTLKLLELPEVIREEFLTKAQEGASGGEVSKSVLQEIALIESEGAQLALWEQAKRGGLTVKQARALKPMPPRQAARPPAARTMTFRYPIQIGEARVTVEFERPSASQEEIVAVLEEALEGERARLPGGSGRE